MMMKFKMFTKKPKVSTKVQLYTQYTAFTLAETLITLAIIGVVAALVIPMLMNKTNDKELVTMTKSVYADIYQALNNYRLDNGGVVDNLSGSFDAARDQLKPYFNYTKLCNYYDDVKGKCWSDHNFLLNGVEDNGLAYGSGMILNNGAFLLISSYDGAGDIFFDVNGFKGPNKWGLDIFSANITKYGLVPGGTSMDLNYGPDTTEIYCGENAKKDTGIYHAGYMCLSYVLSKK